LDLETFDLEMRVRGWAIVEAVVAPELVGRMLADMERAYAACREVQLRNGVGERTPGTLHHLVGLGDSFLDYLAANPAGRYIERYFGGKYILNSFGGNINSREFGSYANAIHRDIRTFSGEQRLLLNTLVMLDAFTADNGATYLLAGGHRLAARPDEAFFYRHAVQAIAPAGSVLLFDSNLWHAAGVNRTERPRRSVTPMYSRPFFKPQFDYPRALGYKRAAALPEDLRQVLGYNARVPATLDEWYQPPERRMYRSDQG